MSALTRLRWPLPAAALVLALGGWPYGSGAATGPEEGPARRLLGPVATLAAGAQWVRFDLALRDGRPERAYGLAESALALDPRASAGWSYLASHLAHGRGAPDQEPDPERRSAWMRAALEVLRRGEQRASRPEELAFHRGLLLGYVATLQPDLPWPGGAERALSEAAEAFESAARGGHPLGAEAADGARAALAELRHERGR